MESPVDSQARPGSPAQSQHYANDGVSVVKSEPSDLPSSPLPQTASFSLPLRPGCSACPRSPTVWAEANAVPNRMQEGTDYLEKLCTRSEPEVLESGVPIAKKLLDQLRDVLNGCKKDSESHNWIKAIDDLQQRSKPPRTVLGVVGITGAGKSSLINALLDEERSVFSSPSYRNSFYFSREWLYHVVSICQKKFLFELNLTQKQTSTYELSPRMHCVSYRDIIQLLG
jgi:hypothetical protein